MHVFQAMHASVIRLFEYTRSRVTERDILDFSPGDPGYPDYVKMWTEIWRSGGIPQETEFDLSEVIGLTGWARPEAWGEPERFRRYRRFTSAVGVALLHQGNDSDSVRPANYLARDLVVDLDERCGEHLALLRAVAESTRTVLNATNVEVEFPYFTFAMMILAQRALDWSGSERAAAQLMEDEGAVRANTALNWLVCDDRFLLGLSVHGQLRGDWISLARGLRNPTRHEETQLVMEAMSG
ncbi:hypothetical protein [Brevifollis gellanilyticus]|nr:hypothetical protein [Brevifollis gellanilyticus]